MTEDVQLYGGQEITVYRTPEEVLSEARAAAVALKNVVSQTSAVIRLGQSEHLKAEAWQTLGHFYGLAGRIRETRFVDFGGVRGFEAFAELVHINTGKVVSTGEAMCLSDEDRWSTRPRYEWRDGERVKIGDEQVPLFQLRSMAQTRALSKAHSNALKWVVVLAGYNPTPAEEVEDQNIEDHPQQPPAPQRKSATGKITDKQAGLIWGNGHGAGLSKEQIIAILKRHGFDTAKDVTTDGLDAILREIDGFTPTAQREGDF